MTSGFIFGRFLIPTAMVAFLATGGVVPASAWIVPHAGGAIPVLADRIAGQASLLHADDPVTPEYLFASLKRLH